MSIGKEPDESGGLPIHAIDLQPRSLKALAMDSLLKNQPNVADWEQNTLKTIGIPPAIVEEIGRHKVLEQRRVCAQIEFH